MNINSRISELLVETGAYTDLEQPVILASGELGIYYINTEKLCQDGGEFNDYGDDSLAMIKHAVRMMNEHPAFKEVINILSRKVEEMFPKSGFKQWVVSGGQRRDWLFSGPVAKNIGAIHISLYKDGRIEGITPYGDKAPLSMDRLYAVHIVDLITEGSSCYKIEDGEESGWVGMLRKEGATINDLLAVVSRKQGGEEMLSGLETPVETHSFVSIDEDFVRQHSKYPARTLKYIKDPRAWSKNYLRENGALAPFETLDSKNKGIDRLLNFMKRYGPVLKECGRSKELDEVINEKYGGG